MEADTYKNLESKLIQNLFNLTDIIVTADQDLTTQRYISPMKLRQVYRNLCKGQELLLQIKKRWNNTHLTEMVKLERFLIHFLLERCYWIHYGDNQVVCDLLEKLFEVDGHLGKIFDFQQLCIKPKTNTSNFCGIHFQTTWSEETLFNEKIQPFHYFLEHTNKMKILFAGQRLVERCFVQNRIDLHRSLCLPPCSRTFVFPETLITLMEYGLFADSEPNEVEIGKLLTGIIGVILNSNLNHPGLYDHHTQCIIKVGNALLRAVPYVNMPSLLLEQKLRNKEQIVWCIVQQMSAPHLLPKLMLRCTGPQELQHLCRRTIRHTLYENWMLPQGITMLPLPTLMKNFINLQFDF